MMTKQELAKNFILNIEKERLKQDLTQAQMAVKLQMSLSGYKKMISGATTKIDLHIMYLLHSMTGKWIFELVDEQDEYSELILGIKQLSASQKRTVKGLVDFELEFSAIHEDAEEFITVFVPTGNIEDGMIFDSSNFRKINASAYRRKFGDKLYCGIQITSDHLHPVYHMDDILLICRGPIREGDTGIFLNKENGCAYIRKLLPAADWVLEPVNGYGQPIVINRSNEADMQKWIRFGYVLTKMREHFPDTPL